MRERESYLWIWFVCVCILFVLDNPLGEYTEACSQNFEPTLDCWPYFQSLWGHWIISTSNGDMGIIRKTSGTFSFCIFLNTLPDLMCILPHVLIETGGILIYLKWKWLKGLWGSPHLQYEWRDSMQVPTQLRIKDVNWKGNISIFVFKYTFVTKYWIWIQICWWYLLRYVFIMFTYPYVYRIQIWIYPIQRLRSKTNKSPNRNNK